MNQTTKWYSESERYVKKFLIYLRIQKLRMF